MCRQHCSLYLRATHLKRKKNSLGGDTINDPESRDFPACTAIFGIRFAEREPRLVFTWMREITWMLLLTGKGFVSNTIQVKSNSKLLSHFKEIFFKSTKKTGIVTNLYAFNSSNTKNKSQKPKDKMCNVIRSVSCIVFMYHNLLMCKLALSTHKNIARVSLLNEWVNELWMNQPFWNELSNIVPQRKKLIFVSTVNKTPHKIWKVEHTPKSLKITKPFLKSGKYHRWQNV